MLICKEQGGSNCVTSNHAVPISSLSHETGPLLSLPGACRLVDCGVHSISSLMWSHVHVLVRCAAWNYKWACYRLHLVCIQYAHLDSLDTDMSPTRADAYSVSSGECNSDNVF